MFLRGPSPSACIRSAFLPTIDGARRLVAIDEAKMAGPYSALEYARRLGFEGEVLDVAGNAGAKSHKSPWRLSASVTTKR